MARQDIEKAQSIIKALEQQRNQAFNQIAQMQVLLDDQAAEIIELKALESANSLAEKMDDYEAKQPKKKETK